MNDILHVLRKLRSKRVIKCTTGGGAGSILKIELEGNSYFFFYCAWRIEQNDVVVSTSEDNPDALIGRMATAAQSLVECQIISITITKQFDLIVFFNNGFCFKAFCNISYFQTDNGRTYDTNWELCLPNENLVFSIDNYFSLIINNYY
ncbi:hypothetical protein [Dysgonomonas sp. BGC7]|uniref:hypothetical protein n=1 Tax=Dysgonomonas sp. BGC7 TaxID=1658008 RepID=UPI0006805E6E|nr:hypothetical protein [Dysgonomonas sp. BGC7]MBD8388714.1 hypothetical protein [Dysgonomonas sp. BGC7]